MDLDLITHYYSHAIQIVDWYQAADRWQQVAQAAFSSDTEQNADIVKNASWDGQVQSVIYACGQLAARCEKPMRQWPTSPTLHGAGSRSLSRRRPYDWQRNRGEWLQANCHAAPQTAGRAKGDVDVAGSTPPKPVPPSPAGNGIPNVLKGQPCR